MAWDDVREDGQVLWAFQWNDMISDQKAHKFRHAKTGIDAITPADIGAATEEHIHDTIDGGTA